MTSKTPAENRKFILSVIFILSMLAASAFIALAGSSESELSSLKRTEAEYLKQIKEEKQKLADILTSEIDKDRFFVNYDPKNLDDVFSFSNDIVYMPKQSDLGNQKYQAVFCSKSRELESWLGLSSKDLFEFYKGCEDAIVTTMKTQFLTLYEEVPLNRENFVLANNELISKEDGKICAIYKGEIYPFVGQSVQSFVKNRNICISYLPVKFRFEERN